MREALALVSIVFLGCVLIVGAHVWNGERRQASARGAGLGAVADWRDEHPRRPTRFALQVNDWGGEYAHQGQWRWTVWNPDAREDDVEGFLAPYDMGNALTRHGAYLEALAAVDRLSQSADWDGSIVVPVTPR